jgi:hypothetical protein
MTVTWWIEDDAIVPNPAPGLAAAELLGVVCDPTNRSVGEP